MSDHADADTINYTYRHTDLIAFGNADADVESYTDTDAEYGPDAGEDSYAIANTHRDPDNSDPDTQQHIYSDTECNAATECNADAGDLHAG